MLGCFLLMGHGPRWAPLVAIPLVLVASAASLRLILLGIRGLVGAKHRPSSGRRALPQWFRGLNEGPQGLRGPLPS